MAALPYLVVVLLLLLRPAAARAPLPLNKKVLVWPKPTSISWPSVVYEPLTPSFSIRAVPPHPSLRQAIAYYGRLIRSEWHTPLVPQGANYTLARVPVRLLVLSVSDADVPLGPAVDESYTLSVPADSAEVDISAVTAWGAIRGLETFSQLAWAGGGEAQPIVPSGIEISDRPHFTHRGILLDTARRPQLLPRPRHRAHHPRHGVQQAQRLPLAHHRLPVHPHRAPHRPQPRQPRLILPLHALYRQGRPPRRQLRRCLRRPRHPRDRHAWARGFVGGSVPGDCRLRQQAVGGGWAAEPAPPQGVQRGAGRCARPVGPVPGPVSPWRRRRGEHARRVRRFLGEEGGTHDHLLELFVNATSPFMVHDLKRTVVYWEDVLLGPKVTVGPTALPRETTVLQTWNKGAENTKRIVAAGYRAIVSSASYYYLDCGHGGWVGNDPGGSSWCAPFKTWQRVYDYDILHGLTEEEATLVLGGEVALWSEQSDATVLDGRLWPRAAAAAETLWSGNKGATGRKRYAKAMDRLNDWRHRMVARGIRAEPLQPLWCPLHPGMCNLEQ